MEGMKGRDNYETAGISPYPLQVIMAKLPKIWGARKNRG